VVRPAGRPARHAVFRRGVSLIIASSFARIFYRNAINIGLPILECPEAATGTQTGDDIEIDFNAGSIINHTRGKTFQAKSFPDFILEIINQGGLIPYTRQRLASPGSASAM
jgi:3-isopropylmalate/(R)-2-methylmalate dehydratase small subunit